MFTKGDASAVFVNNTLPYQVVNVPEVTKKSRSKKDAADEEWDTERPLQFLDTVLSGLSASEVVDLYSSTLHEKADKWGPAVADGFLRSTYSAQGIVAEINETMRTMKKTQITEHVDEAIEVFPDGSTIERCMDIIGGLPLILVCVEKAVDGAKFDVVYDVKGKTASCRSGSCALSFTCRKMS